ncbi:MAG: HEAT repeat domain-containing protein [Gammaproteobacteria bacterium]
MTSTKISTSQKTTTISVTMLLSSSCPHCPTVLEGLMPLIKSGQISNLNIINLTEQPEAVEIYNTRTVPWVQFTFPLGSFELEGLHSESELQEWCNNSKTLEGISKYCFMLLDQGKINDLTNLLNDYPDWLHATLLLVEDVDTSLSIRVGISAIFESLEAKQLNTIYEALLMMTKNNLARIRSDACFYLSLTKNKDAITTLKECLLDENKEVKEIAAEAIADLEELKTV